MTESTRQQPTVVRAWQRISPSLVPLLAVLTALLITVPFMILTGGEGSISRGLNIAGTAYSALIEGSLGLVINDRVSLDDLDQLLALAQASQETEPLTRSGLRAISRSAGDIAAIGVDQARRYADLFARLGDVSDDDIEAIADSLPDIAAIGVDRLEEMRPLIAALSEMERSDVSDLAAQLAAQTEISPDQRTELAAQIPAIDPYSDADLLADMQLVDQYGIVRLQRLVDRLDLLEEAGIEPVAADGTLTADAQLLASVTTITGGVSTARSAAATIQRLDAAGIVNPAALSQQIETVREVYSAGLLTNDDVMTAINTELDAALSDNLVVSRPGNRLVIDLSNNPAGVIYNQSNTPDAPSDDRPETVYVRLGGSALLFFPQNLENMLVRAIPFIIAGLAVALGFKAGLFNIGAEGQLYAGGIVAVWVGFSPIFADLPLIIHLPLVIVVGILGGALWGAIPGALKAYTGAHEVIVTIMLNYVAVLLVDWLIKSTNPVILLDTTATTPRTPYLVDSARVPTFASIPTWGFIAAGIVVLALGLYRRRERVQRDLRFAIRPVVYGVLTAVGGIFLAWVGSAGRLHIGLMIMIVTVWFTDWFLNRTTLGFELRTVGANPDAARYAGMSVKRNMIFAMALSGALAGLAGTIEIAGVQFNMQPAFFAGLGFDAIAVALLARTNPRNMIVAGLLWGSLLAGAGLMQVRADISIDLVKIIQALIIMFIAADAIIRYIWRVPQPSEKTISMFSKGWGS
ncbi:MAG: ABC transporter permease [Anaerolineae bacterium]|nr:ABC transporter permease [Anaerolineae bacterium]